MKDSLRSVELRWLRFDLYAYVCHHIIFLGLSLFVCQLFQFNCSSQTRGCPYKLYKRRSYNSIRTLFFSVRVINVWNSLPVNHVDFYLYFTYLQTDS